MDAITAYENALPTDARIERKKMFGTPCAFIERQMFFGVFENSIIARIGPDRVDALIGKDAMQAFMPTADRPWEDYLQMPPTTEANTLKSLAAEALNWTLKLPSKGKKPKLAKKRQKA